MMRGGTLRYGISKELHSRMTVLGQMALLALALHGTLLFGFRWDVAPSALRSAAQTRGVTIDLAPAPERQTGQSLPSPPPATTVEAPPLPDSITPATPGKPKPPMPGTRTAVTAAQRTPSSVEAARDASRAASAPEPLSPDANPKPVYPELARRRGQEGLVRLEARVDDKGGLLELSVAMSSGFPLLDEAALKAVRAWRFRPGRRAGLPVAGTLIIPVAFVLKN